MIEIEFVLQLLMCLFTDPTHLDDCGGGFEVGVGGEVGEVVLSCVCLLSLGSEHCFEEADSAVKTNDRFH